MTLSKLIGSGVAGCALTIAAGTAQAVDPLQLQLGASAGWASWQANPPVFAGYNNQASTLGGKVFLGIRPIQLIGIELSYSDFGSLTHQATQWTNSTLGVRADHAREAAAAVAIVGYLPLPIPATEVYVKVGAADLHEVNTQDGCVGDVVLGLPCQPIAPIRRWATEPMYGLGAQWPLGHFALRAEYERTHRPGGDVSFTSVGASWSFL